MLTIGPLASIQISMVDANRIRASINFKTAQLGNKTKNPCKCGGHGTLAEVVKRGGDRISMGRKKDRDEAESNE